MHSFARMTGGAVAAGLLAGLFVFTAAGPASAAPSCPSRTITTNGAKVTYTECNDHRAGVSRVWGSVKDTDADGQCAYVNVIIDAYAQDFKVCGEGHSAPFDTGPHAGDDAQVRLSER